MTDGCRTRDSWGTNKDTGTILYIYTRGPTRYTIVGGYYEKRREYLYNTIIISIFYTILPTTSRIPNERKKDTLHGVGGGAGDSGRPFFFFPSSSSSIQRGFSIEDEQKITIFGSNNSSSNTLQ